MLFGRESGSQLRVLAGVAVLALIYLVAPNFWQDLFLSATGLDDGSPNALQIAVLVVVVLFGITSNLWIWRWIPDWLEGRKRFRERQEDYKSRREL